MRRVFWLAVLSGLPGVLGTVLLLQVGHYPLKVHLTMLTFVVGFWLVFVTMLRHRVIRPLQAASNMLSALREGDFSLQSHGGDNEDPMGQVMHEINALTDVLRSQRMGAIEAFTLLNKVVEEIDVAIFTFDENDRLGMINRAGEKLLAKPADQLRGNKAADLGLKNCLTRLTRDNQLIAFPGRSSRWYIKTGHFRESGKPHQLLLLTDVSQPLREEERMAWRRLIRVLGHELNNSLAPIKSLAGSMEQILSREPLPEDWQEDVNESLRIIGSRAEGLSRFLEDFSRIAKLPPPKKEPVLVRQLLEQVAVLSTGTPAQIQIAEGPECTVMADRSQIEQLLINLAKNAVDAVQATKGRIHAGWEKLEGRVEIWIEDEGPGIANPSNLFVPFFSTKPDGSGVGLTLSRQIAEAHDGTVEVVNRAGTGESGCRATLTLPV